MVQFRPRPQKTNSLVNDFTLARSWLTTESWTPVPPLYNKKREREISYYSIRLTAHKQQWRVVLNTKTAKFNGIKIIQYMYKYRYIHYTCILTCTPHQTRQRWWDGGRCYHRTEKSKERIKALWLRENNNKNSDSRNDALKECERKTRENRSE